MTEAPNDATTPDALPAARIRRRRRYPVYVVWLVPLIAAVVAGVLVYERITEYGPTVTIMFRDATGLKPRQSEVRYRGVAVGEVSALELSPDLAYVVVTARVRREAANIAREGSVFWIVRPEVGIETVRGLTTVITGPYIEVFPGSGRQKTEFVGVERPSPALGRRGLRVTLATAHLTSIRPRTAVYYRGVEVGMVSATALSGDATAAHVRVLIEPRYAPPGEDRVPFLEHQRRGCEPEPLQRRRDQHRLAPLAHRGRYRLRHARRQEPAGKRGHDLRAP